MFFVFMKWCMFRKTVLIYTSAILGLIGICLFFVLHISEADRRQLKKIQVKGLATIQTSTEQNRGSVCKDLWIAESDGKRLHDRIESASSVLVLTPVNDHLDIIEHLNQIHCSMQDRIEERDGKIVQQVRCFDALTGVYQYSANRLTAKNVSIALFRAPGSDLPSSFSSPFLTGIAQDISFAIAGKASQFQAKQFKATFAQKNEEPSP